MKELDIEFSWDGVDENSSRSGVDYYVTAFRDGEVVGFGAIWYNDKYYCASTGVGQNDLLVVDAESAKRECEKLLMATILSKDSGE